MSLLSRTASVNLCVMFERRVTRATLNINLAPRTNLDSLYFSLVPNCLDIRTCKGGMAAIFQERHTRFLPPGVGLQANI